MKKTLCVALSMALGLCVLTGCGGGNGGTEPAQTADPVELQVFAAASMTESLTEIAELYKNVAPEVTLVFNFASSGDLKTQIEGGANADIFISAAQKQMNGLEEGGYINPETRFDLLENQVVLVVPKGAADGPTSFEACAEDMPAPNLIAIGNESVPVGAYTEEIFTNLGLWDKISAKASYGSSVKEVLSQVEQASVNCGVVYKTDAATSNGVDVVAVAADDTHSPVIYPAAVLANSANQEAARAFLEYLTGADAAAVFESVGFVLAK